MCVKRSTASVEESLRGAAAMTSELEDIVECINNGRVPPTWALYLSGKPLAAWLSDLRKRVDFFRAWMRMPPVRPVDPLQHVLTASSQDTTRNSASGGVRQPPRLPVVILGYFASPQGFLASLKLNHVRMHNHHVTCAAVSAASMMSVGTTKKTPNAGAMPSTSSASGIDLSHVALEWTCGHASEASLHALGDELLPTRAVIAGLFAEGFALDINPSDGAAAMVDLPLVASGHRPDPLVASSAVPFGRSLPPFLVTVEMAAQSRRRGTHALPVYVTGQRRNVSAPAGAVATYPPNYVGRIDIPSTKGSDYWTLAGAAVVLTAP